ncbi:hypothetical protein I5907_17330 [Panacibacter sp. DH6]|uniref:Reelin domain-containing protein n=1 Tax=Panacibacter microcysteis TaxID=2793269 RepID=A0A931MCB9_9BACT|nr:choice-of-anchor V domain-containing protein [Panacibacter microcysteis]MBG9378005.1 hypothetical protein [Panacibacter microcysteis]
MFSKVHQTRSLIYRQRKSIIVLSLLGTLLCLTLLSYKSGPAKNGQTVTGAPFNSNQTCSKCHSGGNFGGTIKTQLLDSANKVTGKYVPGKKYTFKILFTKTATATPKYAFQTTAATLANANINKWGTLPANTHNTLKSGHNYVEQSTTLTTAQIKIPWTAPVKGTGSVKFYTAGNLVNGNGSTSGDQPLNTILTITETAAVAAAISLNNLSGNLDANSAVVKWNTDREKNIHSYTIEKSSDNINYKVAGTLLSRGGGDYSFTDFSFDKKAWYRIKITDNAGAISYSDEIAIAKPAKTDYKLSLYSHAGNGYIMFSNGGKAQKVQVVFADIQGRPISSGITFANEGDNMWDIPENSPKGIIVISVITEDGIRTSLKFMQN